jgi:hypothetical protein
VLLTVVCDVRQLSAERQAVVATERERETAFAAQLAAMQERIVASVVRLTCLLAPSFSFISPL